MTTKTRQLPAMSQAQSHRAVAGPDPYLELELYLEKVNEEIVKAFDQCFAENFSSVVVDSVKSSTEHSKNGFDETDCKDTTTDCDRLSRDEDRSSDSLSLDTALQDAMEITVNDCSGVHTATQTSPTMSQSSSPVWNSDCSSSFALHTSSSSSASEHGDDTSSLDNVVQQDANADIISSDSELLSRPRHLPYRVFKKRGEHYPSSKDNLELMHCYGSSGNCINTESPVWVLRQDVKLQRRQRSAEDRRGVVFDEQQSNKWMVNVDELDEPLYNLSAHSLPLPNNHQVPASSPSYDRVSYLLISDLGNKSSSAPVLKKTNNSSEQLSSHNSKVTKQPRSQSDRHLSEIQASEACKWLKAAGFPQYAQMYEDHQFPIDLTSVQKDNPFLDFDSWQSLFRRLNTLNRCANVKVEPWRASQMDDSDADADENQCALSENWTFQHEQRRWSRCMANSPLQPLQNITPALENTENSKQEQKDTSSTSTNSASTNTSSELPHPLEDTNLSRTGSERFRDSAKALLRRVESLKSRRRKRQNRELILISGPQVADVISMQQRIKDLNCLEISSPALSVESSFDSPQSSPLPCSPVPSPRRPLISTPLFPVSSELPIRKSLVNRRGSVSFDRAREVAEAMSDSECQRLNRRSKYSHMRLNWQNTDLVQRSVDKSETSGVHSSDYDSDIEEADICNPSRASWHSLQKGPLHPLPRPDGSSISVLTSGQLQVLRKLALLKLTALIEKHCPTHKTGWNWELPKFIRKIKTPDYKDKAVFGVPLSVTLQRSGQPLPKTIQEALRWLRSRAVDQVGIFRKSGVRSRIQILKNTVETTTGYITFDEQQAYDVADMVKQYFRELPEALLTTKLSETLILIFQYVPVFLRGEAVSYVLLLMPNEHCEVLQTLLEFLQYISEHSSINQMTASNLALCFAPSLFYFNQSLSVNTATRQNSVSPRRRKATGVPDPKELSETKAAHDCLLYLIKNYCSIFTVSKDMLSQCNFSGLDESKPLPLIELGADIHTDWRGYLTQCQNALLKESKEKSRGWVNISNNQSDVDLAYKKVGDGHPLRLWRVVTEVEAPPREVLRRVLWERHIWDSNLIKMRVVESLDEQTEVFQYTCESMPPLDSRDYCVLRTWRMDGVRTTCVIVETSVEHENAETVKPPSVRAIVLASRYLIEPCGSGKSRLMHLSRVDTMGRTPEWYNKNYGHLLRLHLSNIRSSFKHSAAGPESKV